MVTFLTLFLGLTRDLRTVDLAVGSGVAAVELRLDDQNVAKLTFSPWRANVDFGELPRPHFLTAVAYDAEGKETGRATQRINLPRTLAEARLILLPGTGGKGRSVKLSWECAVAPDPTKVVVTFDGKPLAAPDPARIRLPDYVPEQLHFMRAELDFTRNLSASAEITFGGQSRDETEAELTAVAVMPAGDAKKLDLPPDAFVAGGRALRVVAVEEDGPAEIVLVRDEATRPALAKIASRYETTASGSALLDRLASLGRLQRARFVWPFTETFEHRGGRYEIFPSSEDFDRSAGGLVRLVTRVDAPGTPDRPRLADAVAIAGLSAVSRNRARAVVAILGGSPDGSALSPAAVRGYLSAIGVPLFVWTAGPAGAAAGAAWKDVAEVYDVSTADGFKAAADRLFAHVSRQRIVWVDGLHLPQDVGLSASAKGATLVR